MVAQYEKEEQLVLQVIVTKGISLGWSLDIGVGRELQAKTQHFQRQLVLIASGIATLSVYSSNTLLLKSFPSGFGNLGQ